ncbi:unnamed protein product [Hyaloperonospora brassicae]|uniref:FYVE-type domain-containing protein n=1 Tax=Hyaloperonospora brassicae TaxID=162125 RepID=A0AAV0UEF2_HYABA|nr:unnamed protein product [Hyaloperonospora brassicae]
MSRSAGTSEAIRLAQASDWKGLQRLLERDPTAATHCGDHGMLPLHWVCTVRHVPLSLLAKLLQAHPAGVQTKNDGHLLPLQIAIRTGVPAACLRKLVRAYPEAVSERMPDGSTALEMAEANGLEADKLKVLYRARDRSSSAQQVQQPTEAGDDSDVKERESDLGRVMSGGQEEEEEEQEGEEEEVSRVARGTDEGDDREGNDWTDGAGPDPFVGNVSFDGFLDDGDDDGESDMAEERSTLEPGDSVSMMSEQSLSDMDALDEAPPDQLVSPSSISVGSRDDLGTSHSPRSSCDATQGTRRGLSSRGFQDWTQQPSRLQQRHTTSSLAGQLRGNGAVTERGQRIIALAMAVNGDGRNTRAEEDEAAPRRGHGRHSSLPVMLHHEYARQNACAGFHDEADDIDELVVGKDNGSPRDSISPGGGVVCAQVNLHDRLFHSVRDFPRRSITRTGSQRSSPPFFRSSRGRASHESNIDQRHADLRPEWKHDDECSICRASFGMFKHRHHCRNCGKSICSQHSADKKISIEAKGFTVPQRVCVTCYAMIAHSRSRKHDLEVAENDRDDSVHGPCSHQHVALGAGDDDRNGVRSEAPFPSATAPVPGRGFAREGSQSPTVSNGSLDASPVTGSQWSFPKSGVLAAGEATDGASERVTPLTHAHRLNGSSPLSASSFSSSSAVHELRGLLASQQKQIQQLAQSNLRMQQQLLERDHFKTETMQFINQLMTRVAILELQTECSLRMHKRRSAETGESEDDEEFPHDEAGQ